MAGGPIPIKECYNLPKSLGLYWRSMIREYVSQNVRKPPVNRKEVRLDCVYQLHDQVPVKHVKKNETQIVFKKYFIHRISSQ